MSIYTVTICSQKFRCHEAIARSKYAILLCIVDLTMSCTIVSCRNVDGTSGVTSLIGMKLLLLGLPLQVHISDTPFATWCFHVHSCCTPKVPDCPALSSAPPLYESADCSLGWTLASSDCLLFGVSDQSLSAQRCP